MDTTREAYGAGTPQPSDTAGADVSVNAEPWVVNGIAAGVLGALVIAVFFFVVDLFQGRPLWTPAALGSAVFLGQVLGPEEPIRLALVLGYTAIHGLAFVGFGLMASFTLMGARDRLGPVPGLLLAAVFFAAFEVFFLTLTLLVAPDLMSRFGLGDVATANLLSAGAMAGFLIWRGEASRRGSGAA
jgi:hypothetical protein